jgi:hypothetical protein
MAWDETGSWVAGAANLPLYAEQLARAADAPARNAGRRKVLHPGDMPWEMSRQGLLKHLLNEALDTRMETVDAYMQLIPAGSRSGRHRHLAEECLYVLVGAGSTGRRATSSTSRRTRSTSTSTPIRRARPG